MKSIKADVSSVSPSSLISSDLGLTLKRSALKLFTVDNAHYQLNWNPLESGEIVKLRFSTILKRSFT